MNHENLHTREFPGSWLPKRSLVITEKQAKNPRKPGVPEKRERNAEICSLRAQGVRPCELARRFGLSKRRVNELLDRYMTVEEVESAESHLTARPLQDHEVDRAVALRRSGLQIVEIMAALGRSMGTIHKLLSQGMSPAEKRSIGSRNSSNNAKSCNRI